MRALFAVAAVAIVLPPADVPDGGDLFPWLPAHEVFVVCSETLSTALAATREGESPVESVRMTCLKHLADAKKRVDADRTAMHIMDECDAFAEWAGEAENADEMCVQLSQAHASDTAQDGLDAYKPENEELAEKFCAGCKALDVAMPACDPNATTTDAPAEAADPRWSGNVGPVWGEDVPHGPPKDCDLGDDDCQYVHDGPRLLPPK